MLAGVVVVLLVGFTGYQALKARTALQAVAADLDTLRGQITSGDQGGARATLTEVQRHARVARDNTHGPGWWVSSRLPGIGPDVRAVRTVAEVSDALAADVLPDVITATDTLAPEKLRPVKGRIDLDPIRAGAPAVVRASTRLSVESRRVQSIDVRELAPQIGRPVQELQTKIAEADTLADRASRAVRLVPGMLGGDGERRYLFLFQNNAEIRATGGIPGAFATITASNGKVKLQRQDNARSIGFFSKPPTPLTAEEKAVFGAPMGLYPQSVNFTPDFPRSAELLTAMYEKRNKQRLDGVVSVDPVALSQMLRGTGPVDLGAGRRLTADNAVKLLLSDVYADIADTGQQDAFFSAAARKVFDAVSAGKGNPRAVLKGLATAASERRILIWSRRPDEQKILTPTAVGGGLVTKATKSPDVGVFLNAAQAYKLDYYLDYETSVLSTRCSGTRQLLTVKVTLRSRVPKNYRSLSSYVSPRSELFGRGSIVDTVFFFAPVGGSTRALAVDGELQNLQRQTLDGRQVVSESIRLLPGQTRTIDVRMYSGRGQTGDPHLRVTPGVRSSGMGDVSPSAC